MEARSSSSLKQLSAMASMDSIFLLDDGDRAAFLHRVVHSFGCVYVCLWSYFPSPSNCLMALDGLYRGSLVARRLFDAYRESVIFVDNGRIPGLAFKGSNPYMELRSPEYQRLVSGEVQQQFYQEANIKTIVFMGCAAGEIELGMPNDPHLDMESEMENTISGHQPLSFFSSSLLSLSVGSPEKPPLLFNNPTPSFLRDQSKQAVVEDSLEPTPLSSPIALECPHDQAREALSQIRNLQLPTIESEDAAMTRAILAALSSPSPSTSSSSNRNLPDLGHNPSPFRAYGASFSAPPAKALSAQRQNKFKRVVLFFRNLDFGRRKEYLKVHGNVGTVNQLQHMISERRRREKLNESFQILRSLLPPGSKKDKASVLSNTTEYLGLLRSQVAELSKMNEMLESQLSARKPGSRSFSSSERINVEITRVSTSASDAKFLDLRVQVRGEISMLDLVIRLLEFSKQQLNATLLSVESNTTILETIAVHLVMLRLRIERGEFDEAGFEEGVRRVVGDQAN